ARAEVDHADLKLLVEAQEQLDAPLDDLRRGRELATTDVTGEERQLARSVPAQVVPVGLGPHVDPLGPVHRAEQVRVQPAGYPALGRGDAEDRANGGRAQVEGEVPH